MGRPKRGRCRDCQNCWLDEVGLMAFGCAVDGSDVGPDSVCRFNPSQFIRCGASPNSYNSRVMTSFRESELEYLLTIMVFGLYKPRKQPEHDNLTKKFEKMLKKYKDREVK